jgi:hypothetical protein
LAVLRESRRQPAWAATWPFGPWYTRFTKNSTSFDQNLTAASCRSTGISVKVDRDATKVSFGASSLTTLSRFPRIPPPRLHQLFPGDSTDFPEPAGA